MGSLRNPVGPLPSTIYWRRRAVLLSVIAVLALLVTWIVTAGGGGGDSGRGTGADGKNPAPSITPGPSGSGPAISEAPGGRDESGDEETGGSGSGSSGGDGSDDGAGSGSGGAGGSAGGGTGTGVGAGDALPAGSGLPDCTADAVRLSLRSVRNAYEPGRTPAFELTARNTSGGDCKVDLGPKRAVVTITRAGAEDAYWSSEDCPKGAGSLQYRVPAGSAVTYTVRWDRKPSAPGCGTPPPGSAAPGTYLVEAEPAGFTKVQTSFVLEAD
ncbi:hypothetical protein [Streptomyces poriticola]|uniref:hypothetical protein n=1 Tax=Streptomyces poriticola TaxID=3120506 RepID=UPI002FCE5118